MATVNLTNPIAGTGAVAGLVAGNNTAIQTCLNGGIDNANIATAGVANIDPLKLASGWAAYTPAMTGSSSGGTIGNATVVARYAQFGKLVTSYGAVTWGNTTSAGTGNMQVSLPVTPSGNMGGIPVGQIQVFNAALTTMGVFTVVISGSIINFQYAGTWPTGTQTVVSATVPFTWTTGYLMRWLVNYEAA